ncbi:MAG: ATP synthase F1 subunit epsilon [Chitinophagales bacterium]|nr:ATP synthase F1 subunit epsilon [Bacteroidota bacterium]MCB9226582.1 ATP synthase F1 subunit epsilon [Chitinophagales bacterium]
MDVTILTPEKELFSEVASSIKLPGVVGGFEILENHAPLIAALQKGIIEITQNGQKKTIAIEDGFVEVLNNKVSVLIAGGEVNG